MKENEEKMEDWMDEEIELIDEDGNTLKFRLYDAVEYKGEKYAFLFSAEPDEETGEEEMAIFRFNEEEKTLETLDEDLLYEVFKFYMGEDEDG